METKILSVKSSVVDSIKALSKFTSKDKTREYLSYVVYDARNNRLIATDGKRAIRINNVELDLEVGSYGLYRLTILDKVRIAADETNDYPHAIGRVFPDKYSLNEVRSLNAGCTKGTTLDVELSVFLHGLKHIINFRYLLDFPRETFRCFESPEKATVLFVADETKLGKIEIIIMPINEV